ncbi:MAG: site-2 protease family protein [Dehalococcoidia bacterium]|nr:site-2 protease family protein [Dehalococcoidia bacterium]
MESLLTILLYGGLFLAILVPLVVVHELGHFITAKMFGVKVLEFGIGFPPRVKKLVWRKGETEYTINWLPIGGFVRLLGEEDPSDPRSLAAQPRWKRLVVMYAGVVMNVVAAILLLAISLMIPRERALSLAQVVQVADGSPAAEARIEGEMRDGSEPEQGLQPGDIVTRAEGRDIKNTSELIYANRLNLGETQEWVIQRSGSTLTAYVYARWDPPVGEGPTGIRIAAPTTCGVDEQGELTNCQLLYPFTESVTYMPWEAVPKAVGSLGELMILTKNEIQARLNGSEGVGGGGGGEDQPVFTGPVGIADQTGDLVKSEGWRTIIDIAAVLSLNLGIFNALPFPMLDGGRALFVFIEILRGGRRIGPEKEALVHLTGFALLMAGVLVVTWFDISRLVS